MHVCTHIHVHTTNANALGSYTCIAHDNNRPLVNIPTLFPYIHGTPCIAVSSVPACPPYPLTGQFRSAICILKIQQIVMYGNKRIEAFTIKKITTHGKIFAALIMM